MALRSAAAISDGVTLVIGRIGVSIIARSTRLHENRHARIKKLVIVDNALRWRGAQVHGLAARADSVSIAHVVACVGIVVVATCAGKLVRRFAINTDQRVDAFRWWVTCRDHRALAVSQSVALIIDRVNVPVRTKRTRSRIHRKAFTIDLEYGIDTFRRCTAEAFLGAATKTGAVTDVVFGVGEAVVAWRASRFAHNGAVGASVHHRALGRRGTVHGGAS